MSNESASTPAAVAAILSEAARVLIVTHENPDGDGIGSALALGHALRAMGKQVHCCLTDPCPEKYGFLPGAEAFTTTAPETQLDCAVALDCDGSARLGRLLPAFERAPVNCSIDHHNGLQRFATVNWVDAGRPATALMVYELLGPLGTEIDGDIATCLYAGVAADTGFFRFQNTTPEALTVAGELVGLGADPSDIARRSAEAVPLRKALLTGRALASLAQYAEGRVLVGVLELADFVETEARPEDTDGIVDQLKQIAGPQIVILIRESEPRHWRVSMRSQKADVSAVCRRFGGGGHVLAAGCSLEGPASEVVEDLVDAAAAALFPGGAL